MFCKTTLFFSKNVDFVKASSVEEASKEALEYREANELSEEAGDVHFSPFS